MPILKCFSVDMASFSSTPTDSSSLSTMTFFLMIRYLEWNTGTSAYTELQQFLKALVVHRSYDLNGGRIILYPSLTEYSKVSLYSRVSHRLLDISNFEHSNYANTSTQSSHFWITVRFLTLAVCIPKDLPMIKYVDITATNPDCPNQANVG